MITYSVSTELSTGTEKSFIMEVGGGEGETDFL